MFFDPIRLPDMYFHYQTVANYLLTGSIVRIAKRRLLWSPYGIGQTIIFLPCGYFFFFFSFLA